MQRAGLAQSTAGEVPAKAFSDLVGRVFSANAFHGYRTSRALDSSALDRTTPRWHHGTTSVGSATSSASNGTRIPFQARNISGRRRSPASHTGAATIPGDPFLFFLQPHKALSFICCRPLSKVRSYRDNCRCSRYLRHKRCYSSLGLETLADEESVKEKFPEADRSTSELATKVLQREKSFGPQEALAWLLSLRFVDDYEPDLAWGLYNRIPAANRGYDTLADMLEYLQWSDHSVTCDRVIQIFNKLPREHRRASSFKAAIKSYLNIGMVGQASMLHRDASERHFKDDVGSGVLFRRAISDRQWQLAMEVYAAALKDNETQLELTKQDLWSAVAEIPNAVDAYLSFFDHAKEFEHVFRSKESSPWDARTFFSEMVFRAAKDLLKCSPETANLFLDKLYDSGMAEVRHYDEAIRSVIDVKNRTKYGPDAPYVRAFYLLLKEGDNVDTTHQKFLTPKHLSRLVSITSWNEDFMTVDALVDYWLKHQAHINMKSSILLMMTYARLGIVEGVHKAFEQLRITMRHGDSAALRPLIYVHAVRADSASALAEFENVTSKYHATPDIRCWSILLYAYLRSGDLDGAMECFRRFRQSGLKPNNYIYGPLLYLFAQRGDVRGVEKLLDEARGDGVEPNLHAMTSLVVAHFKNDDVHAAEKVARKIRHEYTGDRSDQHFTKMWDHLLVGNAFAGSREDVMRLYANMRAETIPVAVSTYSAVTRTFAATRRWAGAKNLAKASGFESEFHYSILMWYYAANGRPMQAIELFRAMRERGIEPSLSTRMTYVKARSLLVLKRIDNALKDVSLPRAKYEPHAVSNFDPEFVEDLRRSEQQLRRILKDTFSDKIAEKSTVIGISPDRSDHSIPPNYVDLVQLLYPHGEAADILDSLSKEQGPRGLRKLTSDIVAAKLRADFGRVAELWEEIWDKAVAQATFREFSAKGNGAGRPALPAPGSASDIYSPAPDSELELGSLRRSILQQPLQEYTQALYKAKQAGEIVQVVERVRAHGFSVAAKTLNTYVCCLTLTHRVRDALAVCERELIPNFPGWRSPQADRFNWKMTLEFEYMDMRRSHLLSERGRCDRDGNVVPTFRTLVMLAAALAHVRKLRPLMRNFAYLSDEKVYLDKKVEFSGEVLAETQLTEVELKKVAPRTCEVLESMPLVLGNRLQKKFLRVADL